MSTEPHGEAYDAQVEVGGVDENARAWVVNDARIAMLRELQAAGSDISEAEKLEQLAAEAELAYQWALNKVEKQRRQLQDFVVQAEHQADLLRQVAERARAAADNAK